VGVTDPGETTVPVGDNGGGAPAPPAGGGVPGVAGVAAALLGEFEGVRLRRTSGGGCPAPGLVVALAPPAAALPEAG
jgi:hypothetical protein